MHTLRRAVARDVAVVGPVNGVWQCQVHGAQALVGRIATCAVEARRKCLGGCFETTATAPQAVLSLNGQLSFDVTEAYAGIWPKSTAAADYDGDGLLDIAVSNRRVFGPGDPPPGANLNDVLQIRVLFGDGVGGFVEDATRFPPLQPLLSDRAYYFAYYMVQRDLNADGRPELIAGLVPDVDAFTNNHPPTIAIYTNISDGSSTGPVFDTDNPVYLDVSPRLAGDGTPLIALASDDYDLDGLPGLVAMHKAADAVDVYQNVSEVGGALGFAYVQTIAIPPTDPLGAMGLPTKSAPLKSISADLDYRRRLHAGKGLAPE